MMGAVSVAERREYVRRVVWLARFYRRNGYDSPKARQLVIDKIKDITTREWIEAESEWDQEEEC